MAGPSVIHASAAVNEVISTNPHLKAEFGQEFEDDLFDARFREYCQSLTKLSPITARLTKRDLQKATTAIDLEQQLRYEISNIGKAFASEDGQEARKAFIEKRAPIFEGR